MRNRYDVTAVLPYYYPETTGHCQSCNSLLPFLAGNGLRTAVLTCNRTYSERAAALPGRDRHDGVDVYRFSLPDVARESTVATAVRYLLFSVQAAVRMAFFPTRAVLCITTPPFLFAVLAVLCRLRGIPLVLWAMDLYPEVVVETGFLRRNGVMHRVFRAVAAFGYRRCGHIFTLGPVMTERIAALGIDRAKMTEVHTWVHDTLQYIPEDRNPFRRENGLDGRFVVLYSGNMGLVHSFEALLRAAAILAERQPDVLFLLIGNGPKRNEIERSAMERGLPNLRVMDYLPFDQVPQSLSAAHLAFVCIGPGMEGVIAPSKMYASLKVGTPIALAEERPSDLTRVLEDGVEGIRLRPGDGEGLARYITALKADPARTDAARRTNAAWYERNCALNVNAVAFRDCLRGLLDASN